MNRWVESFTIFAKYNLGEYPLCAEHDIIYLHCGGEVTDAADRARLDELGWFLDSDADEDHKFKHWCHSV